MFSFLFGCPGSAFQDETALQQAKVHAADASRERERYESAGSYLENRGVWSKSESFNAEGLGVNQMPREGNCASALYVLAQRASRVFFRWAEVETVDQKACRTLSSRCRIVTRFHDNLKAVAMDRSLVYDGHY